MHSLTGWQIIIIAVVLIGGLWLLSKDLDKNLDSIAKAFQTIGNEFIGQTASNLAAKMNVFWGVLAALITIVLAMPNLLAQLGLIEDENALYVVIGIIFTFLVFFGSGFFIFMSGKERPGFQDHHSKDNETSQNKK